MKMTEADIYKMLCDENNQFRHMARQQYNAFEKLKCEVVDFFRNAKRSEAERMKSALTTLRLILKNTLESILMRS